MKRKRDERNQDEKFHQEDANDYHQQLSSSNIPGNSYFRLVVDGSKEGGGAKKCDSTKRGHIVLAVTQDNQVKQWELLDPQASRQSIREGGQALGYGPGINEPLEIWNQEQRSHRKETGVTILTTDGATTTTHTANAKQRCSRDEKKVANQATGLAKKAKREAASDAAAELAQSQDRNETMKCGRCDVVFMADGWFKKHLQSCHSERKEEFQKKRQRRQVSLILQDIETGYTVGGSSLHCCNEKKSNRPPAAKQPSDGPYITQFGHAESRGRISLAPKQRECGSIRVQTGGVGISKEH